MLVNIFTSKFTKTYDIEISNLLQLKDYLCVNDKEVWEVLKISECSYTLSTLNIETTPISLHQNCIKSNLDNYDTLTIIEKIGGQAIISTALMISMLSVSMAGTIGGTAAAIVATAIVYGGIAAIVVGLGMLMQMLVPTPNMGNNDPSKKKDLMFNGVPNVTEQGGSIPLIFGECLFGGVVIGNTVTTIDFKVGSVFTPDGTIPLVSSVGATNTTLGLTVLESTWYRVG